MRRQTAGPLPNSVTTPSAASLRAARCAFTQTHDSALACEGAHILPCSRQEYLVNETIFRYRPTIDLPDNLAEYADDAEQDLAQAGSEHEAPVAQLALLEETDDEEEDTDMSDEDTETETETETESDYSAGTIAEDVEMVDSEEEKSEQLDNENEPPSSNITSINDIRNGIFISGNIHRWHSKYFAILKTPSFALDILDIKPCESNIRPWAVGAVARPADSRYTIHWFTLDPSIVQGDWNSDAAFHPEADTNDYPNDTLLHYMYGVATLAAWCDRDDLQRLREEAPVPPPRAKTPDGPRLSISFR
ncbi:hypothetical protein DFH09DRAFT_457234 [Mycena vulgaris]|nr:hypothetical protein DFH09DRAFT_457234 [Mycena vulgaris]